MIQAPSKHSPDSSLQPAEAEPIQHTNQAESESAALILSEDEAIEILTALQRSFLT
jgi:hypothetical protein